MRSGKNPKKIIELPVEGSRKLRCPYCKKLLAIVVVPFPGVIIETICRTRHCLGKNLVRFEFL